MSQFFEPLSNFGWYTSIFMSLICAILSGAAETSPWWISQAWDSNSKDDAITIGDQCSVKNNFITYDLVKGLCINDNKVGSNRDDDDVAGFVATCTNWNDNNAWDNLNSALENNANVGDGFGNLDISANALKFQNAINITRSACAFAAISMLLAFATIYFAKSGESHSGLCHKLYSASMLLVCILNVATFGGISGSNPLQNISYIQYFTSISTGGCAYNVNIGGSCLDNNFMIVTGGTSASCNTLANSTYSSPYGGWALVFISFLFSLSTAVLTAFPVKFACFKCCYGGDNGELSKGLTTNAASV